MAWDQGNGRDGRTGAEWVEMDGVGGTAATAEEKRASLEAGCKVRSFMERPMDYNALIERLGEGHFRQRFVLQVEHAREVFGRGRTLLHIENVEWLMVALYYGLKWTGLYSIGHRNYRAIRLRKNTVSLPGLPKEFEGFRLLHLSDLHIDLDEELVGAIVRCLEGVRYDVCVLTGDFRESTSGDHVPCMKAMARLVRVLKSPMYAVLGNHDFLEMIEPLEAMGIRVLMNETVPLARGDATIHLSGVDDPHFYEAENLQKARDGIPPDGVSILLSHSPEIYRKASVSGYDLMLCGHTHGGQICLPGRIPILQNSRIPRRMVRGRWSCREMQGYTSAGTGACGVAVRFFCPPEIVVHRLVRG